MRADDLLNVSRETMDRLETYVDLLYKWNPRINLVSKSSLQDVWKRHIADSTQIFRLIEHPVDHWVDLGSGGGFPGLVVAILSTEAGSPAKVTLVESDTRKCVFLRSVARETGIKVDVINDRIENLTKQNADILSARALADLDTLLGFANDHMAQNGIAIFPKGKSWEKEVSNAQTRWKFDYQVAKSKTEEGPAILSITGVSSVRSNAP